jgi:hypothetical protein
VPETAQSASLRSRLLPKPGWARIALLLLILFALLRSVLWASVQPGWLAPDEDYHWLYINYLVEKGTFPSLSKPFYTAELYRAVYLTHQGAYLTAPQSAYVRSPHAVLRDLGGSLADRDPAPPNPRPVLHPPLYYLGGVLIDNVLWHKVSVTRLTALRYYSALLGAITIFFVWLLAAQVLAREWQRLAAAALASTQTIMAFSASTITNDVGVALTLTATLALLAYMLARAPRARHGIALGVLLSAAIMVKATLLSLVIVIAPVLAVLWRMYPDHRRELKRVLAWTVAVPAVLAGWWYVRLLIVTHSILGTPANLTSGKGHGPGLLHAPSVAWSWLADVYRGYWFDYLSYEVRTGFWFWLPVLAMVVVMAGFALFLRRSRGSFFALDRPLLRQIVLLTFVALLLFLPPFALDVLRGVKGLPFTTAQGRFLAPAYPGLAVIAIVALRELTRGHRRLFPISVAVLVAGAFVLYWHTWFVYTLERFYGPISGHLGRLLHDATFGKPNFITAGTLAAMMIAGMASFIAAFALTAWRGRAAHGPLSSSSAAAGQSGDSAPRLLDTAS